MLKNSDGTLYYDDSRSNNTNKWDAQEHSATLICMLVRSNNTNKWDAQELLTN